MKNYKSHGIWDKLWEANNSHDVHEDIIRTIEKFKTGRRILEVGFGSGGDLIELAKNKNDVYGIEQSRVSFNRLSNMFGKGHIFFGDALNLPFDDNVFDVVFHQGVLEHFKKPNIFLKEQRRVLNKEGILVVDVPQKWNLYTAYKFVRRLLGNWYGGWERSYSDDEIRKLLFKNGFEVLSTEYRGIWPHRYGKFIFPEKIINRKWIIPYLDIYPIKIVRKVLRYLYSNVNLFKIISSYNLIVVAKKKPYKIGIDARYIGTKGGIERYIKELSKYLINIGEEVFWFTDKPIEEKYLNCKIVNVHSEIHPVLWEQIFLPTHLYRLKIDIYHATANYGIPIIFNNPSFLTIHDIIPIIDKHYFDQSKYPFLSLLAYKIRVQISLFVAHEVFCTTNYNLVQIRRKFILSLNKILVIPMGVGHEFFIKSKEEDKLILDKLGIYKDYMLVPGGLERRKNIQNVIQAYILLAKQKKNNRPLLVITGDNKLLKSEIKLIASENRILDSIKMIGHVNENIIPCLYRNSHIVIYASLYEGFGLPLLEAMAAGKPLITSRIQNHIIVGKSIPYYIDPNNINEIYNNLLRILYSKDSKDLKRFIKGRNIAQNYSWNNILHKVVISYGIK